MCPIPLQTPPLSTPHPQPQADSFEFRYPASLPERLVRRRLRLLAAKAGPFHASRLRGWALALVPQVRTRQVCQERLHGSIASIRVSSCVCSSLLRFAVAAAAKAQRFHASRLRVWALALVPQVGVLHSLGHLCSTAVSHWSDHRMVAGPRQGNSGCCRRCRCCCRFHSYHCPCPT
jgi:hypothetical protein